MTFTHTETDALLKRLHAVVHTRTPTGLARLRHLFDLAWSHDSPVFSKWLYQELESVERRAEALKR